MLEFRTSACSAPSRRLSLRLLHHKSLEELEERASALGPWQQLITQWRVSGSPCLHMHLLPLLLVRCCNLCATLQSQPYLVIKNTKLRRRSGKHSAVRKMPLTMPAGSLLLLVGLLLTFGAQQGAAVSAAQQFPGKRLLLHLLPLSQIKTSPTPPGSVQARPLSWLHHFEWGTEIFLRIFLEL